MSESQSGKVKKGQADMPFASIGEIDAGSAADKAGLRRGFKILSVNGSPLRDVLDWQWQSAEDALDIAYLDICGGEHSAHLVREGFQDWGIRLEGSIFDHVMTCKNSCIFCFMRQLPEGLRRSLYMRDDDFRMSFLDGTFVTLTNLGQEDRMRIIEQRISPLRVSLHAVDPEVRRALMGKHSDAGLENLKKLLEAGIEFDAQIVLVPDINDGDVLAETLEWAIGQPGIRNVGVVPLGFTRHQSRLTRSFDDPCSSLHVLDLVGGFQRRAMRERGEAWVFAADEFYKNAYGKDLLSKLPPASLYGDFPMYEDGIGIIRCAVDGFERARAEGHASRCARALNAAGFKVRYVCGYAMQPQFSDLLGRSELHGLFEPLPVENRFFGGNVNVTGLLVGQDIADAIGKASGEEPPSCIYAIPDVVFNACGVTLDDMGIDEIKSCLPSSVAERVFVVSGNPLDYIRQLGEIAAGCKTCG